MKHTRAAARKRELRVLYSRLAQLQDSDEEDDVQLVTGDETLTVPQGLGKLPTLQGVNFADEAQHGLTQGSVPDTEAGSTGVATGGQGPWVLARVAEAPQPGRAGAEDVGQVWRGLGPSLPTPKTQRALPATATPVAEGGKVPSWAGGPLDQPSLAGEVCRETTGQAPSWVGDTINPAADLPHKNMKRSLPLGDNLLQAIKTKIWRGEYVDMFTLLFRDVELKANMRDDPWELEKIKRMQIDKNFDNWLSAYTVYMGVVLQAYSDRGARLVEYLNLIHRTYKAYAGAGWLQYDEFFHSQAALDPSLPLDRDHEQLSSRCFGSTGVVAGRYADSGHMVARSQVEPGQGLGESIECKKQLKSITENDSASGKLKKAEELMTLHTATA
ncbi:UNVERIFIED_CONTAM: hypothetical protein K2H54_058770 [Gekko kuhli]